MKICLFLFCMSLITFLQAQEVQPSHPIDQELEHCLSLDSMQTTMGMIDCTMAARDAWDLELNRYYKLLLTKLNASETTKLKEAQRAWLNYRDKEIEFSYLMHYNLQGTLYHILAADRNKELVKQRCLELKSYVDLLEGSY